MENAFKIDGVILAINKTRPSKEGSTFMLRDFWLEKPMMGQDNVIKCQMTGNNCAKLDGFVPGDEVVVDFALSGKAAPKADEIKCNTNPNGIAGFSPNITVWKVEFVPGFKRSVENEAKYKDYSAGVNQQSNQTASNPNPAQTASKQTLIPQPAGEVPKGEDGKNLAWDGVKGAWVVDDLPF